MFFSSLLSLTTHQKLIFCFKSSRESPLDIISSFPCYFKCFCFFCPWSLIVFFFFSKAFSKVSFFLAEGSISSPVRHSYLSIFPDDGADIFAAFLLISCCNFSSLILSSIVMISSYVISEVFFLKCERLIDARVASITKKQYGFIKIHKIFKVNIWWMISKKHSTA